MSTNTVFRITFPGEEWRETTTHTFEGPFDHGVQHHLVLVIDPKVNDGISLVEYARAQMEGPKNVMPGYELDREREITMPDGAPAYEVIYHYVPAENILLFQKQVYMIKNGKAFIFSSTYSKKTLDTVAPVIDGMIAGFKLYDPEKLS